MYKCLCVFVVIISVSPSRVANAEERGGANCETWTQSGDRSGTSATVRTDDPERDSAEDSVCLELINGRWFDSKQFVKRTVYVEDGTFHSQRPCVEARVVDLRNGYVVPPFGEAHHHTLVYRASTMGQQFIRDGIFYAKIMAVMVREGTASRITFGGRDTVDVSLAMAGITAPDAHPIQIGLRMGRTQAQLEGEWVHTVTTREELDRKWPRVLKTNPDFVKVFLVNSEEYDERKADPQVSMRHRGLDSRLVAPIVELAHAAGLQVAAHVRTATDFRVALAAGVDVMAHMPGFSMGPSALAELSNERLIAELHNPDRFMISDEDARRARERHVVVVTTIGTISQNKMPDGVPAAHRAAAERSVDIRRKVHKHNLITLKKHDVKIAIGSDRGEGSVIDDLFYIESLGVFSSRELLTMFCETTAQMIFPDRKIGLLRDGYEASFLVLEGNPLDRLDNIRKVKLRCKQGKFLSP